MSDDMNDVLAEALKDATGGATNADSAQLSSVSQIAIRLLQAQAKHARLEKELEEAAAEVKQIEERELPAAMLDLGMKNFEMADGSKITTETVYHAGILVDNRPTAFKWLRESENEALIKADLLINFPKGDVEKADALMEAIKTVLKKRGMDNEVSLDQSVHWATLRAFVKEQIVEEERAIEAGELDREKDADKLFPRELFGVHIFDRAKVVPKKEGKKK